MRRVTNRRVRSSGVGGEPNVLLNSVVQGCPAVQEGQRPIVLLLHVVVLVDDLRVDEGDYVDGVLLRQALRGTLPLHLPTGLVLNLNNCYLVPALSMNIVSGSRLM